MAHQLLRSCPPDRRPRLLGPQHLLCLPPGCGQLAGSCPPVTPPQPTPLLPQMANRSTPMDVLKANFYSAQLACSHALDVLDLHYCFRFLESRRYTDGVHWDGWVHRCITKLLLTHMADAWGVELERGRRRTAPGGCGRGGSCITQGCSRGGGGETESGRCRRWAKCQSDGRLWVLRGSRATP